jgi:hypothetical protein
MNTVVIALITALATLGGGRIAAITGLRVQRSQAEIQEKLDSQNRVEKRARRRRKLRRRAYVSLMNRLDEVERLIQVCWELTPLPAQDDPIPDVLAEARDKFAGITSALNTVRLEGPPSVTAAGDAAAGAIRPELNTLLKLLLENAGKHEVLIVLATSEFRQCTQRRQQAKEQLMLAAQATLEQDLEEGS